jgi:hypothetical protein
MPAAHSIEARPPRPIKGESISSCLTTAPTLIPVHHQIRDHCRGLPVQADHCTRAWDDELGKFNPCSGERRSRRHRRSDFNPLPAADSRATLLPMSADAQVQSILLADPFRWHVLDVASALGLPDSWIGAGFVRNAVWDHLHGRPPSPLTRDVDVIWYDLARTDPAEDRKIEAALRVAEPSIAWSVKNQARMHTRNGDLPYASVTEAMRCWPETATAVAVRRHGFNGCEIAAPFGLDDLLSMILRPTPRFSREKRGIYEARVRTKDWTAAWPLLRKAE